MRELPGEEDKRGVPRWVVTVRGLGGFLTGVSFRRRAPTNGEELRAGDARWFAFNFFESESSMLSAGRGVPEPDAALKNDEELLCKDVVKGDSRRSL